MAMTNVYTGANGILLFFKETGPEGDDADALLGAQMYDLGQVGRVTDVEIQVQTHLSTYHEIGQRHPTSLHSGNVNISGKIGRAYINGALLFLLLGRGANPNNISESPEYPLPALLMNLILQDPAHPETRSVLNLEGVKFENWAFALPEDNFVMENVTFKALRIRVQDEEATTPGGARAVKLPTFPPVTQ
jgi:hypothetical protein